MKVPWLLARIGLYVAIVGMLLGLLVPARSSNCGGNNAAQSACDSVVRVLSLIAMDRNSSSLSVSDLNDDEMKKLRDAAQSHWIRGSAIFVTRGKISFGPNVTRQLVAVCNQAYDNVPQLAYRRAPFTHAVSYADGSSELIAVENFQALDQTRFIELPTSINH
jgi:hypothetical protein